MATRIKAAKKRKYELAAAPVAKSDWDRFAEHVKENPILYAVCAGFIVLCVVAGLMYRVAGEAATRSEMTQYARALQNQDPTLRAFELEDLAGGKGDLSAQALYMMGEAAYEAKDYPRAKEVFERVRSQFPTSPFVADAVEGLGYIAENEEEYDAAVAAYKEVAEQWPGSLARRRQDFNIARCEEQRKNLEAAVAAYSAQVNLFAGSAASQQAEAALERLRRSNPDLFPEAAPQEAPEDAQAEAEIATSDAAEAAEANAEPSSESSLQQTTAPLPIAPGAEAEPASN